MILLNLVALMLGLIALAAFFAYTYIGFTIWAELTPITFDGDVEFRGLYYGYYHAHVYNIWVHQPKMAPSIERMNRLDIEMSRGIIGTRYYLWHSYHGIPLSDRGLKIRSWWALYKNRVL